MMPLSAFHLAQRRYSALLWCLFAVCVGGMVVVGGRGADAQGSGNGSSLGSVPRSLTTTPSALSGIGPMVALRHHITIEGEVVYLHDLFDGVPPERDKQILRAPELGKTVTLDMAFLARLAQNENLNWTPLSQSEQATLTRASGQIHSDDIMAAISQSLIQRGMPATAEIDVSPPLTTIPVPAGVTPAIEVYEVAYNRADGRFTVRVDIRAAQMAPTHLSLTGMAYDTIDVPVLQNTVSRGQVIEAKDVGFMRQRVGALQGSDVITDFDQVIGKAARRVMRPGEAFRDRDIERPSLVTKGSLVTMVLRTPLMQLTAQGRAMQDGAVGDVIKVQNPRSGKTVLGTVIEARTVEVDPAQSAALQ